MARPIYSHEIQDQDFQWLITTYTQSNPYAVLVDQSCVPILLLLIHERLAGDAGQGLAAPLPPPAGEDSMEESDPVGD